MDDFDAELLAAEAEAEAAAPPPRRKPRVLSMKLIADRCLPPEERGGGEAMADSLLSLTRLRLDRLELGSMDGLDVCNGAQHVYLQHNRISRIEGLEFFSDLRFLVLGANEIEAIEGLAHLRALEYLDLSQNRIADAAAHELPIELRALDLYGNPCAREPGYRRALVGALPALFRLDDVAVSARERGHALLEEEEAAEAVLEEAREALAPPRPPPPRAAAAAAAAAEAQLDAAVLADATRLYEHAMSLHGVEAEAAAVKTKARQIRERVQKRREQAVEEQAALRERLAR